MSLASGEKGWSLYRLKLSLYCYETKVQNWSIARCRRACKTTNGCLDMEHVSPQLKLFIRRYLRPVSYHRHKGDIRLDLAQKFRINSMFGSIEQVSEVPHQSGL